MKMKIRELIEKKEKETIIPHGCIRKITKKSTFFLSNLSSFAGTYFPAGNEISNRISNPLPYGQVLLIGYTVEKILSE